MTKRDEDTVIAFLFTGIGNVDLWRKMNYLIIDSKTTIKAIEDTFKEFTMRKDMRKFGSSRDCAELENLGDEVGKQSSIAVFEHEQIVEVSGSRDGISKSGVEKLVMESGVSFNREPEFVVEDFASNRARKVFQSYRCQPHQHLP